MNFEPILTAGPATQLHLITVVIALASTAIVLPMRKGTRLHRRVGWIWAISMMATSLISFWISTIDVFFGFSPIHIFSIVVLVNVPYAIISIRCGNLEAHKRAMLGITIGALGIAGLFTLVPGRTMWEVFFA